jgi:CHAT domain-containing protein
MDTLDRWRSSVSDHDLRLAVFGIQESWADPDLGIATVLNVMATSGRDRAAFELAERRRARDLLDHLMSADALRAEGPDSALTRRGRQPALSAADLIAAIPDDRTAILEYVTGRRGEPTTLFVLTKAGLRAHTLPGIDSLAATVARYLALVESGADATTPGRALGDALLAPALRELPATVDRLVIVADDVLHRLPFDALMLDGAPAVERFAVAAAPSATTLARLWSRSRPAAPRPAGLVLADPSFVAATTGAEATGLAGAFAAAGGLPRLRYTGDEASSVARAVPGSIVRTRAGASEAFLRTTPLTGFRILHLATHAVVDERAPGRTGVALAAGGGHDGLLGPGDLAALELDADLVVLSACRTAGGAVVRGEGVQGLTSPVLEAGARAVVATGWRVRDRAAAQLVAGLYEAMAGGLPAGDALRAAKLEAIRRGAAVRDWAAFTLVGDPLVRPLPGPAGLR